jgi:hypothetical protein
MAAKKKSPTDSLIENQKKTIDSLNTLIDILKNNMVINQQISDSQEEEITFFILKERVFFSFLEKEGYDIIDVYEYINESGVNLNISPDMKKDLIDELMESHKMYKGKHDE